jgi:SpoVK/Ycf46/Vps4 family AAA+-type ATPase
MPRHKDSQYIRFTNQSPLIRKWIATILLRTDLETHLVFNKLDAGMIRGFDTSPITKENCQDAEFIAEWLKRELSLLGNPSFDEDDVFAINTRQIKHSLGLSEAELAVLRFSCLLHCYGPLSNAADMCGETYTETDLSELLASLLGCKVEAVYEALHPSGLLRESGLVRPNRGLANIRRIEAWLRIPEVLPTQVFRHQDGSDILMDAFYRSGPKSSLRLDDFAHMAGEVGLIKRYLRASLDSGAEGANVLLWGKPGTGKTELARYLAQSLRHRPLEINLVSNEGDGLKAAARFDCFRLCQSVISSGRKALIVFDEVEEILSDKNYERFGFREEGGISKGLINSVLESNVVPAIWITNTVTGIDPAYLRRFDIVQEVKSPLPAVKKRIARRLFREMPVDDAIIERIVENKSITPAHLQKANKICRRLGVDSEREARKVVDQVLSGDLKAIQARPLKSHAAKRKPRPALTYRPDLINCDTEVDKLAARLHADSSVRMCLFGPPGTGKSAWAKHLAGEIGRPLIVKQASDIFDPYLGNTEKNISKAFHEATRTKSILMLDEVDSFLPDRGNAHRHWEVTQANQFLTGLEGFEGILLCTTNLLDNLDPATMRRFDFKVKFDYLTTNQAVEMAAELLKALKVPLTKQGRVMLEANLGRLKLAQGDFAALLRRFVAMGEKVKVRKLCEELKKEVGFRERERERRSIGFLR